MTERYPIPSHAASFWIAGDDLWIAFPGQGPEERGHSIRLPASAAGMATAIQIMKERAQARSLRLSNPGTPSQYEVENDRRYKALVRVRETERQTSRADRETAAAELKELGL